ncbi:MAG: class I SAM-dependent methyltransferase [Planctomycetaceae bacterium]
MTAFVLGLLDVLRQKRRALEDSLTRAGIAHTLSPARYRLHRAIARAIDEYARGDCLDAGSGRSPYKQLLLANGASLVSIDVEDRAGQVDRIADLQDMPQIADGSFDTIVCTQVLEHLPRPWQAVREMRRVLRPAGKLIVTVPHLSIIHEAPHDYYRFTCYGLKALCEQSDLEVIRLEPTGGLFSFLGHSASLVLMCTVGAIPGMRWISWGLNYVFVRLIELLDRCFGLPELYPCDYLLVARMRNG